MAAEYPGIARLKPPAVSAESAGAPPPLLKYLAPARWYCITDYWL